MRQKRSKSNSSCWGSAMTRRVEVLGLLEELHMEREPNIGGAQTTCSR